MKMYYYINEDLKVSVIAELERLAVQFECIQVYDTDEVMPGIMLALDKNDHDREMLRQALGNAMGGDGAV